ncbi:MAG: energy transducer TonB [Bacteroidales bacterium]|nr:energy transducer TonB [Bacteroidales bacterium]
MKRNENKVPAFDEIIFENRNKEYGAYDLRKRYKSVTSFSILSALAFCSVIVVLLFLKSEPGRALPVPDEIIIITIDDYKPEVIKEPEVKPPAELFKAMKNVVPVVATDTTLPTDFIPTTEELTTTLTDKDVNDTIAFITDAISEPEIPVEIEPVIFAKEMPEFPGGNQALLDYIAKNIKYPEEAIMNNIQGKVTLKFVVNADGSVNRIEILGGVDPLLDQEAIRVVSTLPKFRPGKQNGIPVPVWFMVPVNFQLKIF